VKLSPTWPASVSGVLAGALDGELACSFPRGAERLAYLPEAHALRPELGGGLGADLRVVACKVDRCEPLFLGNAGALDRVADRSDLLQGHQALRHVGYRKPNLDARVVLTQVWACYTLPLSQPEVPPQAHSAIAAPGLRGPAPRRAPLARRESTSRSLTRSTSALAEFHTHAGHAGTADGCQDCASARRRQRSAAAALRTHQGQARQHVVAILGQAAAS
jgi:hypothetical protein